MVYKLAITISGAVSLGTFESGALYEVLEAIAKHNEKLEDERLDERIEIDVLTGASAGGMTACIAARKLLFEADDLRDVAANSFYDAWVKKVDLSALLNLADGEDKKLSILSSNLVKGIAEEHLAKVPSIQAFKKHPACANELKLGLALSNLNGVDYAVPMFGGKTSRLAAPKVGKAICPQKKLDSRHTPLPTDQFVYTKYQDEYTKFFKMDEFNLETWKEVSLAAVSCGAFPFAFRPVVRTVPDSHYEQAGAAHLPGTSGEYLFTDGGVFQNEPLGLAKNLVDEIDPAHEYNDSRFYLYIAPGAKSSSQDAEPLLLKKASSVNMSRTLIQSVFNQAKFRDWITAETTNQEVLLLDKRADELKDLLISNSIALKPKEIISFTKPFLDFLFGNEDAENKAKARLKNQYRDEFGAFQDSELANAWLSIVQLLEKAAGLGTRDQMKIFGITADQSELAGGKIIAFQGFFGFELRDHDYNCGRIKAREILRQLHIFNDVVPNDDSDIKIDHELDGFDALGSLDPKYLILLSRLGNRALGYFADGVLRFLAIIFLTHPLLSGLAIIIIGVLIFFLSQHFKP